VHRFPTLDVDAVWHFGLLVFAPAVALRFRERVQAELRVESA